MINGLGFASLLVVFGLCILVLFTTSVYLNAYAWMSVLVLVLESRVLDNIPGCCCCCCCMMTGRVVSRHRPPPVVVTSSLSSAISAEILSRVFFRDKLYRRVAVRRVSAATKTVIHRIAVEKKNQQQNNNNTYENIGKTTAWNKMSLLVYDWNTFSPANDLSSRRRIGGQTNTLFDSRGSVECITQMWLKDIISNYTCIVQCSCCVQDVRGSWIRDTNISVVLSS